MVNGPHVDLVKTATVDQAADIFTKPFECSTKWSPLLMLINIVDPTVKWGVQGEYISVPVEISPPMLLPIFTYGDIDNHPLVATIQRCGAVHAVPIFAEFNVWDYDSLNSLRSMFVPSSVLLVSLECS